MLDALRGRARRALVARPSLSVALLSAVLVSLAFQAITMARNEYIIWRFEFTALELAVAVASSLAAGAFRGLDERGEAWASGYAQPGSWAHGVLRVLPSVAARAALMTACLALVNATVVPTFIYHEPVEGPVLAVPVRFLADIPQGFLLCLVARLSVDALERREAQA